MVGNKVIDPSISPNPMSLKEWMEGQNYPDAIVMTGRMSDEAGSPFVIRDDVMSAAQRARFETVSAQNPGGAPNRIATKFLNLQFDDPIQAEHAAYKLRTVSEMYHNEYEYSIQLRQTYIEGNDLARIDDTGELSDRVMDQLKPVRAYQHWLEGTGGVP